MAYGFADCKNKVQVPTMSDVVETTLLASAWSGSNYTLTVNGVTATSVQEILPAINITENQLIALQGANIQDGGQSENTIVLHSFASAPEVDIPIRIILRKDL